MKRVATSQENVLRVLRHLGVEHLVRITEDRGDRVIGALCGWSTVVDTPKGNETISALEDYCRKNGWQRDTSKLMKRWHKGGVASYRESDGCRPAMQIVFLSNGEFEADLDYFAPVDVVGIFGHLSEVLMNKLRKTKTNQAKVAELLDARFGKETAANA